MEAWTHFLEARDGKDTDYVDGHIEIEDKEPELDREPDDTIEYPTQDFGTFLNV